MARMLTNAEVERYQWIIAAASDHAGQWLNPGRPQNAGRSRDELVDIHSRLLPAQQQAVERMVRGSSVDGSGRPHFGEGLGPVRPSRARALRSGLEAILADAAAKAAPPPTGPMQDADQYLDAGLRLAFAEEQLRWSARKTGGGMRYPRLFRSRHPDSQIHAVAARRLVRDLAGRSGLPQRRVMRMLLEAPPNHRFDVAAGIVSRGRLDRLPENSQGYAHSVAANEMRQRFGRLGRTAEGFGKIGQRWKQQPRWVKVLAVVVAVSNLPVSVSLLLAARATRAVQRSQRAGLRVSAWRHARGAVRSANRAVRRELKSPTPLAPPAQQPAIPYAQPRLTRAYAQPRPNQIYAPPRPTQAYTQQPPGQAYPQPRPTQAYTQQGPRPAYPQQGPAPVNAPQSVPMNAPVLPVQGQGQAGAAGGRGDETVRLTPGWAAATTGTVPLHGVSEEATASMAVPPVRPGHQQRGPQQDTSQGRHGTVD